MTDLKFETVVVGAGPAGLAAACTAAECGRNVALVDETPWVGGQIWRGQSVSPTHSRARHWFARFQKSNATLLNRTCVIASVHPGLLLAECESQPRRIHWERLILATGARELFLPFPGWTLPGVVGPGGLLSMVKNGWPVEGQRVVVAGSGPLLLAAAQGLAKHGARVVSICEQASKTKIVSFAAGLWRHPAKLGQAVALRFGLRHAGYHFGVWPVCAEGVERVQSVTLTDGERSWNEACDLFACGFGLVPNLELPVALGCELKDDFVRVDLMHSTSAPNVYCAGELTGIGGAEAALIEGQIAGYAAAGKPDHAEELFGQRASWHRFCLDLTRAFALRPELTSIASDETILCRCEDVTLGALRSFKSWREAKLHARCGMGPCQGRVCGPAAKVLLGWRAESVRPPISPARVGSLISEG